MGRLVLLLSAVLAISTLLIEGRLINSTSYSIIRTCEQQVDEDCLVGHLARYEPYFGTEEAAIENLKNRTLLDALALDLTEAVECMDNILDGANCPGVNKNDWDAVRIIAYYYSSPERIDILQAALDSQCLTNEAAVERLILEAFTCYLPFMEAMESGLDPCVTLAELEACLVTATSRQCGPQAGAFVQSMWDIVDVPDVRNSILSLANMEEASAVFDHCQPQVNIVRRFAKRALVMLKK